MHAFPPSIALDENLQLVPLDVFLLELRVRGDHRVRGLHVGVVVDAPVWLTDFAGGVEET